MYYSPQALSVRYEKKEACVINYLRATYTTEGSAYYISDFSDTGEDIIDHVISIYKNYPAPDTTYNKSDPYESEKAIRFASGSPGAGMFMSYEFSVEGERWSITLGLP